MMANRLISNVTDVRLHDYGCSLKAYRRDVLQHVRLYGELHRFIPALASQVGRHRGRGARQPPGAAVWRSKYGISRTVRVMLDLITSGFWGPTRRVRFTSSAPSGCRSAAMGVVVGVYL
jgi:hypothetical protein